MSDVAPAVVADSISVLDKKVAEMHTTAVRKFGDELADAMRTQADWLQSANMEEAARYIGEAAANTLADNATNVKIVKKACLGFASTFLPKAVYGDLDLVSMIFTLSKIQGFEETKFGAIWWAAVSWAFADDLITLREAAELSGTKLPNISQSGKLTFFINPDANLRQDRRMVLRSQVLELWPPENGNGSAA